MNKRKMILLIIAVILLIGMLFGFYYLYVRLPIINGYAAKNMCSCVFVAGREQKDIEANDLNFSLVKYASNTIDFENKTVTSSFWGMRSQQAFYNEKTGCSLVNTGKPFNTTALNISPPKPTASSFLFADFENVKPIPSNINQDKLRAAIGNHFIEVEGENTRNTRAIVVLYGNQLIAEQYAEGFDKNTKQLGWSMAKSIMSTLTGILVQQGKIDINQPTGIETWQNDDRKNITWNQLLQMNSGLKWKEDYASISDVTKMLYTEDDIYSFAVNHKLDGTPGKTWEYSSGTSNILSGLIREQLDDDEAYLNFASKELFNWIGAESMVLETDPSGTIVGSSYAWATPRDWAKYGLLYLQNGKVADQQIFPDWWAEYTATPAEGSEGKYGAQFWKQNDEEFPNVPKDMYFADGFQGQRIFIIPSKNLVVVRLGLANKGDISYDQLLKEVIEAVE